MTTLPAAFHPEQLLTPEQAIVLLGISMATLQGWRSKNPKRAGGPPFIPITRQTVRYRWRDLKAYIDARTVVPTKAA